jgi:hypothetical protein
MAESHTLNLSSADLAVPFASENTFHLEKWWRKSPTSFLQLGDFSFCQISRADALAKQQYWSVGGINV